ncbi:MAG: helix-turn-helix domain-containing protein [Actinomycetota bacterium]|nr:helix-turn-helix domain-containing protein [Actinomycetota bacterium]
MPAAEAPRTLETLADAAARHRVSVRTLRRRIAAGQLTAYRHGPSLIRLDPAEVDVILRPTTAAGNFA